MEDNPEDAASHQYADVVYRVMRRQATLGLSIAAVFIVLIVGLPLFNQYFPKAAATPVAGFTLTWLLLGVAVFPITWLLSYVFVRLSDQIESDAAKAVTAMGVFRGEKPEGAEPVVTSTMEEDGK